MKKTHDHNIHTHNHKSLACADYLARGRRKRRCKETREGGEIEAGKYLGKNREECNLVVC